MNYTYCPNQYSQQRQYEKPVWIYPVRLAMEATAMRNAGHNVTWNPFNGEVPDGDIVITEPQGIDFLSLPFPDRKFTMAHDPKYQLYGNYKYHPATHMQVADGCWHGKCTFCVERHREWKVRDMGHVFEEIDDCYRLGIKEIFDDSGTFPDGDWLTDFCIKSIQKPYHMVFGCNMRIGADVDFKLMKRAGFRMLLYGIESTNQYTLNKIQKGIYTYDIVPTLKRASDCGLEPHIAVMFGYPWSSEEEELETLRIVHFCLRKGYAHTAQASVYNPQRTIPGYPNRITGRIYNVAFNPEFWYNKIKRLRSWTDIKYLLKSIRKGVLRD